MFPKQMFSCEYCEIFNTTYFENDLFEFVNGSLLHWPKGSRSRL